MSALERWGNISLATKDVDVYSADSLDFAAIDSRFRNAYHTTGVLEDVEVVFRAPADFVSTDSFIPLIQDSADDSTFKTILAGPDILDLTGATILKGIAWKLPMPLRHRRYVRVGATPKSSGTFTAKTVEVRMERGQNQSP